MIPLWKGFQGLTTFWRMYKKQKELRVGKQRFAKAAGIETEGACQNVAGGIFKPCWKCGYLFNRTSGKVSKGAAEDFSVKK